MLDNNGEIRPTLANMTLDGLEKAVLRAVPRRLRVSFVRYADDFIVTDKSKRILETMVKPAIEEFLAKRGLALSKEKTAITHIRDGFTFLGQDLRRHNKKLHITPSKEGIRTVVRKVGMLTRKYQSAPMVVLIKKLNALLRGWANYHKHVVSSKAFSYVDYYVLCQLWECLDADTATSLRGGYATAIGLPLGKSMCSRSKRKSRVKNACTKS